MSPAPADHPAPTGPVRIGLTGPIGCGKSTVGRILAAHGATVIDADLLAREVTAPGEPALEAVRERFGPGVMRSDGTLDRDALGRRVFADPDELRALEAIVHPAVRPRIAAALEAAASIGVRAVVLEAIRLVDAGYVGDVDEVWLVSCTADTQARRLAARGLTPDAARARMAAQAGLLERARAVATRTLDTNGSLAETELAVETALAAAVRAHRAG